MTKLRASHKATQFTESVIREMTRLALHHGAVNLSQGFPDFPAPPEIKAAAERAIEADVNQYTVTWGTRAFRQAIASDFTRRHGVPVNPETDVTVCCGSTEAMAATMLGIIDPGDEVIVFEPFYENYGPDIILSGAVPRYVTLREPDWSFDPQELAAAFSNKTRAIVVNTPNNPTGKVFTRDELETIARLCRKFDVVAIMDEIYEHIVYGDARHVSMMAIEGMAERTVSINSLSKTFSVTGWRVGWAVAAPALAEGIRKVHDFLTVNAPAPMQDAGVFALGLPDTYYRDLAAHYQARRDRVIGMLRERGFACFVPSGAYYVMTDVSGLGASDDVAFARMLIEEVGVAAVPGSSFYRGRSRGRTQVRFCFCKRDDTLAEAERRLARLRVTSS
jgi:aspartate/methionine/tyrosine aminotransferase